MGIKIDATNNSKAFRKRLKKISDASVTVGIHGSAGAEIVKVAYTQEYGATIKPKKKFLAIPTKKNKNKPPRSFGNTLRFVKTAKGGLLVKDIPGSGKSNKGARSEIMYYLLRRVKIPERSFIRTGFDKNVDYMADRIALFMTKVMRSKMAPQVFLDAIGAEFAGKIQEELQAVQSPGLAPITKQNKGSNNPLIDTGRLVQAISWEVKR